MGSPFENIQLQFGRWLQRRTATFSKRKWVCILILYAICMAGYGVFVALNADRSTLDIDFQTVRRPSDQNTMGNSRRMPDKMHGTRLKYIESFKKYLDSLSKSPLGKSKADSILSRHPGLLDSIANVEELYNNLNR